MEATVLTFTLLCYMIVKAIREKEYKLYDRNKKRKIYIYIK